MISRLISLILFSALFFSFNLRASIDDYFLYKVLPSNSNYGNTGILEIPNARFMTPASLRMGISASYPNEYTYLTATPFPWFEATYRYAEIKNKKYGPVTYSGNQSLKDKGFDIKIGISEEGSILPAIAVGLRDIGGTGLFASEYIVFTKRVGKFDLTTGIGWGLLGSANNISNPFKKISSRFDKRLNTVIVTGGEFGYKEWFTGKAAILGGLEYNLNRYGLRLKLEYDTSKPFQNENVDREPKSDFNFGLNFHPYEWLNIGAAYERGNQFRFSFSFKGNFFKDSIPKPKPKNVVSLSKEQKIKSFKDKEIFYRSLNKSLRDESIFLQAVNYDEETVEVAIASSRFFSITRSAGRTARIASALASDSVKEIIVRPMNGDLEVATISFDRVEFDQANEGLSSANELLYKSIASSSETPLIEDGDFKPTVKFPEFRWSMSPALKHQIGGPEGFYLGQLYWRTDASLKLARNLTLYSSFGINLYDTFKDFNNPSFSTIPHVRSDIQDYLTEGKNNIIRMQLEYFFTPYKDVFIRTDIGLLEEMFGGLGGQALYRPFSKKYALGLSLHRVKQRDYDQRFSFRDYETTTGHFELYAELPNDIFLQALAGKYLAGDKGITLDLSRRYKSGFVLGVFATKTDLSALEFGEGSFDKGFYFSIPTKLFYSDYTTGVIGFGLHPLTKDGGAILGQQNQLFTLLGETNKRSIHRDWDYVLD